MSDGEQFNPQEHLTKVGPSDYLPVVWRIVWFRERNPHGIIRTELVEHVFGEYAVFKATVIADIRDDGSAAGATGYGSETIKDFRDYLEKAETKAIGRALAALGYGTAFSAQEFGGEADAGRIVDSPVNRSAAPGRTEPPRDKSTTVNTAANVPVDLTGTWTGFWKQVEATGLPRDKAALEKSMGQALGADPAYALERFQAWRKDMADQKVLA